MRRKKKEEKIKGKSFSSFFGCAMDIDGILWWIVVAQDDILKSTQTHKKHQE